MAVIFNLIKDLNQTMSQTQSREVLTLTQSIRMLDLNPTESLDLSPDTDQTILTAISVNRVPFSEK